MSVTRVEIELTLAFPTAIRGNIDALVGRLRPARTGTTLTEAHVVTHVGAGAVAGDERAIKLRVALAHEAVPPFLFRHDQPVLRLREGIDRVVHLEERIGTGLRGQQRTALIRRGVRHLRPIVGVVVRVHRLHVEFNDRFVGPQRKSRRPDLVVAHAIVVRAVIEHRQR